MLERLRGRPLEKKPRRPGENGDGARRQARPLDLVHGLTALIMLC
jgi:hypothetical protein